MKKTAELYFAANAADWAQATAYSSRLYVTRFVEALASDDVQMLTRASAAAALAKTEIRHDGTGRLSNSTRRTVNGTIKAFLNWMIDMEMIDANPLDQRRRRPTASKVQSTKIDAHGLPSVKQAWEMIDRVRNAETRLGAEIILRTGLRPGEVRGLHGEDIRDDHIHVVRTATNKGLGKRTKTGKVRDVPAPADLLERMRSDTWLFPGTKENVVVDQAFFRRHWREVVSEIRMHDLRHIHATVLLRERVPIPQAAAWLGHSPAVLMSTYAGVLEDLDLRDRVDRAFLDDRPATFDRQDETP